MGCMSPGLKRVERVDAASTTGFRDERSWLVAVTAFLFVLLQSVCTAVATLSGVRLLIGAGSLAAAWAGVKYLDAMHGDAIRTPMLAIAVIGSIVNLYIVWRIRSLRARSSSSWRTQPAGPRTLRSENLQIALALLTLVLVGAEMVFHLKQKGHF
jgi:hypothetical protein